MKAKIIALFKEVYGFAPDVIARAPGRIEFIGNHTDYNGGTVLGAAIDRGIWVAVRAIAGTEASFYSGYVRKTVTIVLARATKLAGEFNFEVESSLGRELVFVASHAVHHYALLAAHLRQLGLPVPEGFGLAPATVAHARRIEQPIQETA